MILPATDVDLAFPGTTDYVVPLTESQALRETAVVVADGRVLYVFRDGDTIKQGYASSVDGFFTNGSVGTITTVLSGVPNPSAAVFTTPEGGLYLMAAWGAADDTAAVRCYRSPLGLGGDWVLQGTAEAPTYISGNGGFTFGSYVVGVPKVYAGGRFVLPGPYYTDDPTGIVHLAFAYCSAWVSADYGVTWSLNLNVGYYIGDRYGWGCGRAVAEDAAGTLWWSSQGAIGYDVQAYSTNQGSGWTTFSIPDSAGDDFSNWTYIGGDTDGYLYRFGYEGNVYRTLTPTVIASWALFRAYPLVDSGPLYHASIMLPLGETWMIAASGRVIMPTLGRGGWVIGAVTLD